MPLPYTKPKVLVGAPLAVLSAGKLATQASILPSTVSNQAPVGGHDPVVGIDSISSLQSGGSASLGWNGALAGGRTIPGDAQRPS